MMITISNAKTEALIRRYAKARGLSMTAAVEAALCDALRAIGESVDVPSAKARSLKAQLADALRASTKEFVRLREAVLGKRSGSRVYQMLGRHDDPVEVLRRLIAAGPTAPGFRFCVEQRRLDLVAETIALDPRFAGIVPEEIKAAARRNLAWAEQHGQAA
jgi:hypothetical protein